jgi:hypothetical protein
VFVTHHLAISYPSNNWQRNMRMLARPMRRAFVAFAAQYNLSREVTHTLGLSISGTSTTSRLQTSLLSTTQSFQPAEPPGTQGVPIFPDVDLSQPNLEPRCKDKASVVVVTGASRGIGLQFVKSLAERAEVSLNAMVFHKVLMLTSIYV